MRIIVCIILSLIIFTACDDKKIKPTNNTKLAIENVIVNPKAVTDFICGQTDNRVIKLNSGEKFKITFKVKSDKGLSQYKVDIHQNFDCHTHRISQSNTPWKVLKIVNLNGFDSTITEEIIVPTNVTAGNYHFMLQVIDNEGNEINQELYSLKVNNISDTLKPEVEVIKPILSDSVKMKSTENLDFNFKINDNRDLQNGKIEISYFNPSNLEFTVLQDFFRENNSFELYYNHRFSFPFTPIKGKYKFVIKVFDATGNVTVNEVFVYVQ